MPAEKKGVMTLDELIADLRRIKKANPRAGKKPVYAGETIVSSVSYAQERGDSIILRDNDFA